MQTPWRAWWEICQGPWQPGVRANALDRTAIPIGKMHEPRWGSDKILRQSWMDPQRQRRIDENVRCQAGDLARSLGHVQHGSCATKTYNASWEIWQGPWDTSSMDREPQNRQQGLLVAWEIYGNPSPATQLLNVQGSLVQDMSRARGICNSPWCTCQMPRSAGNDPQSNVGDLPRTLASISARPNGKPHLPQRAKQIIDPSRGLVSGCASVVRTVAEQRARRATAEA